MDYKEKYEELVEAARAVVEGNPGLCDMNKRLGRVRDLLPEKESEDERIRKEIIEFIGWAESRGSVRNDWHQKKRPAEWIAYLEKQKEQKPTEWSEEDERNLYNIIEAIKYTFDVSEGSGGSRQIIWLKSHLRPQPHWKPSEEQMEALSDAYVEASTFKIGDILESLYNDLKKL